MQVNENQYSCIFYIVHFLYEINISQHNEDVNPIHDGGTTKRLPTSLSPSTSTKVGISPQTIWLLILTVLTHWCKISRSRLFPIPYYWTWTKSIPLKIWFFWRNPYKTDVMTAPLIEMLDLPNFGLMTSSTV